MHLKKTALIWAVGLVVIAVGLFWGIFGTFDASRLSDSVEYRYEVSDIAKLCKNNGIDMEGETWRAQTDDAYFTLQLPRRARITAVKIELAELSENHTAQIYYSSGTQMKGDAYWEIELQEGSCEVKIENSAEIKNVRFDLTEAVGEQYAITSLEITTTNEHRIQYFIFAPVLMLLYMVISFCYINREFLARKIALNPKWFSVYETADQIMALSISDFKGRFSGSYLGIFWGIIQPLSTILLFWFVFQIGFRSNPIDDVPFILWLAAGMIPWNYFYDAWYGGTSAFTSYSYIVKKVVFKVDVLPLVKVLSSSILNLIFNVILVIIYCLYGRFMGLHLFDMLYFSVCLFALTLGLSYITATLNVFMKDVGQFMGIILQVLMWMTPLMWSYEMIPDHMAWFYKLNPLHYVLNGYRESLINGWWFYHHWLQMIWFWAVTLMLLFLGRKMMGRMKDHFADVL